MAKGVLFQFTLFHCLVIGLLPCCLCSNLFTSPVSYVILYWYTPKNAGSTPGINIYLGLFNALSRNKAWLLVMFDGNP